MGCAQSRRGATSSDFRKESTPSPEVEAPAPKEAATSDVAVDLSKLSHGCTTVEFFDAVFRVAEPIIRKDFIQRLIYKRLNPKLGLRKNEEPIDRFDAADQPLYPIQVKPRAIHLLTFEELESTKGEWKNFQWPKDLRALWDSDGFLAFDLIDLDITLVFKPGVELCFGGDKASIEIGSDKSARGGIPASLTIKVPKLRAWWSSKYKELSVAFMEPLAVDLNLSANLDLFGMDVVNKDLEDGMLESLIEHVLSGYGPQAASCPMPGFAGNVFGWTQQTFFSERGNGRPFVIDLSEKPDTPAS